MNWEKELHKYPGVKLEAMILGMEEQREQSCSLQRLNAVSITMLGKICFKCQSCLDKY